MSLSALYDSHKKELIFHAARIVACPSIAEDIVQESFMVFFREAKTQQIDNPGGFLYRVCRNLAYDYLKHKKVTENYSQAQLAITDAAPESPSVEQIAADDQYTTMLREVIDELPPRCREVFVLHKIRGMAYAEIAQLTGISESGVEKHMMKGLLHCRKRLKNLLPEHVN